MRQNQNQKGNVTRKRQPSTNKPGTVFIGAYVPKMLKENLQSVAAANKRSMNAQLEMILAAGIHHLRRYSRD